jgi:hypothetical protein
MINFCRSRLDIALHYEWVAVTAAAAANAVATIDEERWFWRRVNAASKHVVRHGCVDKGSSLARGSSTSGAGVYLVATGSSFAITARGRRDRDEWAPSPRQPQHAKAALIFTTRLNSGRNSVAEFTKRIIHQFVACYAINSHYRVRPSFHFLYWNSKKKTMKFQRSFTETTVPTAKKLKTFWIKLPLSSMFNILRYAVHKMNFDVDHPHRRREH